MKVLITNNDTGDEHEIRDVPPAEAMDYLALCKLVPVAVAEDPQVFSNACFDGETLFIAVGE